MPILEILPFDFSLAHYQMMSKLGNEHYPMYPTSVDELRVEDQNNRHKELFRYLFHSNDVCIGYGQLQQTFWSDDPHSFSLSLCVGKAQQGQGFGTEIYEFLLQQETSHEIRTLEADSHSLCERGPGFLTRRGFKLSTTEFCSTIPLDTWNHRDHEKKVQRVKNQEIEFLAYAELRNNGYTEHDLYKLISTLERDVPWHEAHNPETFEQWLHRLSYDNRNEADFSVVAINREGQMIGVTEVEKRPGANAYLYQGLTGVLSDYRKRGIATAMKIVSFQRVQESNLAIDKIWTENEEHNPMFILNQKLGFKREFDLLFYQKKL